MSKITVWFIKCAMTYFLLAILLGIHMAMGGPQYPFMQIHAHFNLLGWMSMMIYGVAYHILPRFSGRPLYSERIAEWHFWLANTGLVGMAIGWFARQYAGITIILMVFSIVSAISAFLFVFNMFKTIKMAQPMGK